MAHDPTPSPSKDALRAAARARLEALPQADLVAQSNLACRALIASDLFAAARTILLYAPAHHEPNLSPLASAATADGKTIGVPAVLWGQGLLVPRIVHDLGPSLIPGKHGIRVPAEHAPELPIESIDLVIVPGLAFDREGGRLGRGGGFYDRFLADPRLKARTIAVALEPQIVPRIPMLPHDRRIDALATPAGVFFC